MNDFDSKWTRQNVPLSQGCKKYIITGIQTFYNQIVLQSLESFHIVPLARLEGFRARLEGCRPLNPSKLEGFRALNTSNMEAFRALIPYSLIGGV